MDRIYTHCESATRRSDRLRRGSTNVKSLPVLTPAAAQISDAFWAMRQDVDRVRRGRPLPHEWPGPPTPLSQAEL